MSYEPQRTLDAVEAWAYMADVTGANVAYTVSPVYGQITKIKAVRYLAIAGTDNVITLKVNGTAVTGGTITMETTDDAAGDTDEVDISYSSTALVNEGDTISFTSGGQADNNTTPCVFTATITKRRH